MIDRGVALECVGCGSVACVFSAGGFVSLGESCVGAWGSAGCFLSGAESSLLPALVAFSLRKEVILCPLRKSWLFPRNWWEEARSRLCYLLPDACQRAVAFNQDWLSPGFQSHVCG